MLSVPAGDEEVVLLPNRAVVWPRGRALLVADLHFGKAATFRGAGIPVPEATTGDTLGRLDAAIALARDVCGVDRLIVLGDLIHAHDGRHPEVIDAIGAWSSRQGGIEITLVRGNHDRRAGDPPREWGMICVDGPMVEGGLAFCHEPGTVAGAYVMAGHIHPMVSMAGPAGGMRAPCFWFGSTGAVLPAFGAFTGGQRVLPVKGDRVYAIGPGQVVELSSGRAGKR